MPSTGKDGGPLHEAMINLIPLVMHALQKAWPDMRVGGTIDESFGNLLMDFFGIPRMWREPKKRNRRDGKKIPDGIIAWDHGIVLIEIGKCHPDKWPGTPWIHWSFTGHTTVINHNGDPMIDEVAEYLQIAAESPDARLARLTETQRLAA
jgi:hypothetical protein